ncbi:plasma membrane fusion protein prm1, partial [Tilletia horrida]
MRQDLSSSAPLPSRQWRTGVAFNPHRLFFQNSRSPPPFLGKRSRLALAALSPTFLSIFILLVSVAIPLLTPGASPIETRIDQAKDRLTAACAGVQAAVGAIQGVPHYMAQGTNRMIANGIEFTVSSLGHLLMLLIYATEKVLIYIVDTYRSLLQCLIELLIRGVLAILVQVVQILSEGINSASLGIKSAVQAAVSSVNTVISSALTGINDVLRIVGKSVQVPQINVPDLSALDNVRLPTFFQDGLIALNNSIPTLDAIKDKMNSVIAMPLEAARTDVNKTINAFTFDRSVLDVPPLPGTALPVCNASTIAAATKPLDDLAHAVHKLELGLLVGLLLAMLIVALCTVALEWWAWRSMWRHIRLIREICGRDQARDDHPLQQQPLSTSAASLPMTSSKAAEAKAEEASQGVQRRYADGQPARQVNEPASSYWLNAPDAQDEQLAAHDGSYGHQQVTFSPPTRRAASDQLAQSSPLNEAAHAAAGAQSNTQPPASTRFVVVSDHCIELPAHPSPSPKRARLDPLASDRGTLDLVHLVHHPLATSLSLRLASTLRVQRAQTLDALRWFFGGWLGHPGMIALLAFAVFGALSTQIHILALQHIAKEYDGRLYGSLNDASSGIRQQLQDSFVGQSVAYANQVNNQIQVYENRINQNVFGWVNTTTGTMNNTLNEFVDMVNEAIS